MSSPSFFLVRLAKRRRHTPPSFLASRGFAAQGSRTRALPLLNLKKKKNCSQSMSLRALFLISPAAIGITKRNYEKCLCKILEGRQRVLWYFFQQCLFSVVSKHRLSLMLFWKWNYMDIIWTFHLFVRGFSIEVSREGLNGLVAVNFEYFDDWRLLSRNLVQEFK